MRGWDSHSSSQTPGPCLRQVDLRNSERRCRAVMEVSLGKSYLCPALGQRCQACWKCISYTAWQVEMWVFQCIWGVEEKDLHLMESGPVRCVCSTQRCLSTQTYSPVQVSSRQSWQWRHHFSVHTPFLFTSVALPSSMIITLWLSLCHHHPPYPPGVVTQLEHSPSYHLQLQMPSCTLHLLFSLFFEIYRPRDLLLTHYILVIKILAEFDRTEIKPQ